MTSIKIIFAAAALSTLASASFAQTPAPVADLAAVGGGGGFTLGLGALPAGVTLI